MSENSPPLSQQEQKRGKEYRLKLNEHWARAKNSIYPRATSWAMTVVGVEGQPNRTSTQKELRQFLDEHPNELRRELVKAIFAHGTGGWIIRSILMLPWETVEHAVENNILDQIYQYGRLLPQPSDQSAGMGKEQAADLLTEVAENYGQHKDAVKDTVWKLVIKQAQHYPSLIHEFVVKLPPQAQKELGEHLGMDEGSAAIRRELLAGVAGRPLDGEVHRSKPKI